MYVKNCDPKHIASLLRAVPDFPRPGVTFRDVTGVLRDPRAFKESVSLLGTPFDFGPPRTTVPAQTNVDVVVGVEARGFIFGAALAACSGVGFVPVRKPGKLPCEVDRVSYKLEYGEGALELHRGSIQPGQHVLVVDDVLATGGTAKAAAELVALQGGVVVGFTFLVELDALGGRRLLHEEYPAALVCSVLQF